MFKVNQEVYIISSMRIEKAVIKSKQGEFYTIRELESGSAYRVRQSRLYATIEEAVKDPYYRLPVKYESNTMHPHIYELYH